MSDWLDLDTWITSDHHWEHPRIRQYQHRPENHFELMRELWIERVGDDEPLLHLGDLVCFGDMERHPEWLIGLPGRKYLIRGNHDKHTHQWYAAAGFEAIGRGNKAVRSLHLPDLTVAFSHEPLHGDSNGGWFDVNVHGHIHANPLWYADPGVRYVNACVEVTGYAPVRLRDLLEV